MTSDHQLRLVTHLLEQPVQVEQLPAYLRRAIGGDNHSTLDQRQTAEAVYRVAAEGVPLSRPVSLDDLPGYLQRSDDDPSRLLRGFLHALHPPAEKEYTELRMIRSGSVRRFFSKDIDDLLKHIDQFRDSANVYVGVATRTNTGGGTKDDCGAVFAIWADLDFKDYPGGEAEARSTLEAFLLPPSLVVHSGGGLHCYWLLNEPLPVSEKSGFIELFLRGLARALNGDRGSAEVAHVLRVPGTLNHKYTPPRPVVLEAFRPERRYDVKDFSFLAALTEDEPRRARSEPTPAVISDGSRNDTLFREGCRLRRLGWQQEEIATGLRGVNLQRCAPPLPESEIAAIAHSCCGYPPASDTFPATETGDAEFFAACNADAVRFDHRRGRWLLFDGQIWSPQTNGEIARLALESVRARQRAAVGDEKRLRWAAGGESRARQTNLLALAESILPISDAGDSWDLDPWLLGAPNGVIDLKTGTLRPGRPEDRITMRVRPVFDPEATCPLWDKTINEIFKDDPELIAYVDRYIGYSLTGDCREEALAFCWGGGANGKGTLMNTIAFVLGDYADDLPFSAFELQSRAGIPNDIAKIANKRFVTASETGETQRLNEARVKALTGRDPITARFLHQEFFTFEPVAKFWLATNHKPQVRDDSEGFWRRLHLIPFTASFLGKEDKTLKDRLRGEASGILARAVRGCLTWQQQEGLNPPTVVQDATKTYRTDSMPLSRFLDECCVVLPLAKATFGDLFKAYVRWSDAIG